MFHDSIESEFSIDIEIFLIFYSIEGNVDFASIILFLINILNSQLLVASFTTQDQQRDQPEADRNQKSANLMNVSSLSKLSRTLSLSLLCLSVSVAFTVNPSSSTCITPAVDTTSTSTSTCSSTTSTSLSSTSQPIDTTSTTDDNNNMASKVPVWFQHQISVTAPSRGCHLITGDIQKAISSDLSQIKIGMANVFIQHTSASLTINENADPDVRR